MSADFAPFTLHPPAGAPTALVLDSPHSGREYPDDFDHSAPRSLVRQAEDAWVGELFAGGPALGATLIEARFPRTYIDANRSLADLDAGLLDEPWPAPIAAGPKTRLGIGLVWRVAHGGVPMYSRKLTVREVSGRIDACWRPYHAALAAAIDERHQQFGCVWHVNCHSMPSLIDPAAADGRAERPDFVIGDRDGTTCSPAFTGFVVGTLSRMGYRVAVNDPYKGVEIVRVHGTPQRGRHSLQIEVNRRLYMDEATQEKTEGFAALRRSIDVLLGEIACFVADSLRRREAAQ